VARNQRQLLLRLVGFWDLVAPELERMGILGRLDVAELEAYCRVYERWRGTEPKASDWLPQIDRTSRLAQQLGCSPAARLRMTMPAPAAEEESAIFSG
jgi:phage terminase small subunit